MKINLGCGNTKLEGYVNVDADPNVNPDVVMGIEEYLKRQESGSASEIVMFHTIEHIPKMYWLSIFTDINRVLKINGEFLLSFPEWEACAENFLKNHDGKREFWEATLYGRQLSPTDYHVAICQRHDIRNTLIQLGFGIHYCGPEIEAHNSLVHAIKITDTVTYEDKVKKTVWSK